VQAGNPMPQVLPVFDLPDQFVIAGAITALVLGLVAGAIPAWQAMRLRISEALRRGG
jgi:putative ABC transport system permease protein